LPNVRLVDLEELHQKFRPSLPPEDFDDRLEAMARASAEDLRRRLVEPWIDARLRSVEAVRRREVANARRFLGDLSPEQEDALEHLTRRLVARLLVPSVRRVRSLPPGPEGDRDRRFALELLGPEGSGTFAAVALSHLGDLPALEPARLGAVDGDDVEAHLGLSGSASHHDEIIARSAGVTARRIRSWPGEGLLTPCRGSSRQSRWGHGGYVSAHRLGARRDG